MINWKVAAKFWYSQFSLWQKAYNEIADVYMIDESFSVGTENTTVTRTDYSNGKIENRTTWLISKP